MSQTAVQPSVEIKKVRSKPWPVRHLFGEAERSAAMALFDRAIERGEAFGYNGAEEKAYCEEFARYVGGGFADAVNSGTSAVYVALKALDLEPFSEVIVPPVSDPGGIMPVALLNCIPVPADAAPGSYNIGAEQIKARLSVRTRAIMVTHISGLPCDMDAIMEVARARNIPVIEDCAQAHGAIYKGRHVGTIGTIGAFSTMFGKHHATGGQGGIVYTQSEELYWKVRRAADRGKPFGLEGVSSNVTASLNLNTEELSCAIGRVQLEKLPRFVEARRAFAMAITRRCKQSLKTFRVMEALPGAIGSFWFMFLKFDVEKISATKTELVAALREQGIPFESGYWHSPIDQEWFKKHHAFGTSGYPWSSPEYKGDSNAVYELPNGRATEACHLRLLMHENCGEQEVEDVIAALQIVEAMFAK